MKFNETLVHSMVCCALIHPNRVSVLDHLFGAFGTGYEWYKGKLREGYPGEQSRRRELKNIRKFFREEFNTGRTIKLHVLKNEPQVIFENMPTFTVETFTKPMRDTAEYREMENVYTIKEVMCGKEYALVPDDIQERLEDRDYTDWHEIQTEYSLIMHVPDDVKPDWLNAAFEYLTLLLESNLSVKSPTLLHITCKSVKKGQIEADRVNVHNHRIGNKILKSLKRRFSSYKFEFNKIPKIKMAKEVNRCQAIEME